MALRKPGARRKSQTFAAICLRERQRERRPRGPETIRRQASAGEAHLQQEPFPTRMICKKGAGRQPAPSRVFRLCWPPLARPGPRPRLALGVECRTRRREPSIAPPHACRPRANHAHACGRQPIFSHAAAGSDVCGRPLIRADCPPVSRRCGGRPDSPTPCVPGFPSKDSTPRYACCCPCRFRCAPATT